MVTGPVPLPPPPNSVRAVELPRLDAALRAHPDWSIRYAGEHDTFVAWRKELGGETERIERYTLCEVLDELEQR